MSGNLSVGWFVLISVIKILIAVPILLGIVAYTVWLERKLVGHIQNRWGPSRVGPFGLLQPIADGLKLFFKEDLTFRVACDIDLNGMNAFERLADLIERRCIDIPQGNPAAFLEDSLARQKPQPRCAPGNNGGAPGKTASNQLHHIYPRNSGATVLNASPPR